MKVTERASREFLKLINESEFMLEELSYHAMEGDWEHGDCYVLAGAVHKWLGPRSRMMAVMGANGRIFHVVVEMDGLIVDGGGIRTPEAVRSQWSSSSSRVGGLAKEWIVPLFRVRRRLDEDIGPGKSRRSFDEARGVIETIAWVLEEELPLGNFRPRLR